MTGLLLQLALQVPDSPKDYDNAWQWVAGAIFVVAIAAVVALWRQVSALTTKMQEDVTKQRDEWKGNAETCRADFGKTGEALKVSNDSLVLVIGKIDRLISNQEKLNDKLDRNWERLGLCTTAMERLQDYLERAAPRSIRGDP